MWLEKKGQTDGPMVGRKTVIEPATNFDPKIPDDHFLTEYDESMLATMMEQQLEVIETLKGLGGSVYPGAFVSALECATGRTAEVIGKPSLSFFRSALNELQLPADQVTMIGDDVGDVALGAMQCGMLGLLVRTGKWRPCSGFRVPLVLCRSI
ncbi:hypothetical protein BC832DRAFT_594540 [Gaertneriomyces semiglobifer]|nr:hypothetical protein BC832DRAFT_594540 [Gaertneriomyces semiglobifer]